MKQVTDILRSHPIRSNASVITYEEQFYHPIESVDESTLNHSLLFVEKTSDSIKYKLSQNILIDTVSKKELKYEFKDGQVKVHVSKTETTSLTP